jgi:site-specific recombinase XerC
MQRPQLFLRCIRDMDPRAMFVSNTGMTMTKKQVSKFLTVLTRVETLEKELEPGKERERLSDAKLELQRVLSTESARQVQALY